MRLATFLLALPLLAACSPDVTVGPPDCSDGTFYVEPNLTSARYAPRDQLGTCQPTRPAGAYCADSTWCDAGLECRAGWQECWAGGDA